MKMDLKFNSMNKNEKSEYSIKYCGLLFWFPLLSCTICEHYPNTELNVI